MDVAAERRRLEKDLAAAQKELASTAAKLGNADFFGQGPEQVVGKIRDRQRLAQEETERITARLLGCDEFSSPAGVGTGPGTHTTIACLWQVEHLLDQRWPETKIEPSLTRISALMDLLGSPQLGYPSIHVAGTNGKTSVVRMIDALLPRCSGAPAEPPARTCNRRSNASRSTENRSALHNTWRPTARSSRSCR